LNPNRRSLLIGALAAAAPTFARASNAAMTMTTDGAAALNKIAGAPLDALWGQY
jgi:hypothetical protein